MRKRLASMFGAFALAILLADFATAAPTFTGIGDLSGGQPFSRASDISGNGLVVVGYSGATEGTEPFRWTATTGIVTLTGAPQMIGVARGVSADGSIVVGDRSSTASSAGGPYLWTESGGIVPLNTMNGAVVQIGAYAISADGSTVGGKAFEYPSRGSLATGWVPQTPANTPGTTFGLSADGSVAVGTYYRGQGPMPVRWTSTEGFQELGDLPGGRTFGEAYGISADGSVVVGYSEVVEPYGNQAFRWTNESGMLGLESPPSGSVAFSVSADGTLVGGVGYWGKFTEGVLWDEAGHLHSVRELLRSMGAGDAMAGWSLYEVVGISEDLRTITGNGANPLGRAEAWIATTSPADVNGDWVVNVFDINLVVSHWGEVGSAGDANGDGAVNIFDINAISAGWSHAPGSASAAVPEPSTWVLLVAALSGLALWRGWLGIRCGR